MPVIGAPVVERGHAEQVPREEQSARQGGGQRERLALSAEGGRVGERRLVAIPYGHPGEHRGDRRGLRLRPDGAERHAVPFDDLRAGLPSMG